ncbi:hypothetical protein BDN71DRAFT_642089 [Pleurotus eryngii]|uniref:Uncharacterized protein n=1 Tax=Pleurotus eryngii TaxID=5323 RepID=A0A9P6DI04_PLEER|nr:hypothetical protein BDN71DRAFT_642089 [Pleurotus eryngii]
MLIARILFLSFMTMAGAAGTAAEGLRNVTIDDGGGDETTHIVPTYLPPEKWSSGGHAMPNTSLAHNRTWHGATVHPGERALNISFSFTGVALFVYCIIANTPLKFSETFDAFANYTFVLDEEVVATYKHGVEKTRIFYDVPVYVNQTLENKSHNFSIIAYPEDQPVLLVFDYAVYTTCEGHCVSGNAPTSIRTPMRTLTPAHSIDAPTSHLPTYGSGVMSTPEPRPNVGIIVAATLAGLVVFILSGTFLLHRFRQAKRSSRQEAKLWRQSRFIVQSKTRPPSESLARGDVAEKLKGYSTDTQTAAHDSSIERPDVGH